MQAEYRHFQDTEKWKNSRPPQVRFMKNFSAFFFPEGERLLALGVKYKLLINAK